MTWCSHDLGAVFIPGIRKLQTHPELAAVFPYFQRARLPDANAFDIRHAPCPPGCHLFLNSADFMPSGHLCSMPCVKGQ